MGKGNGYEQEALRLLSEFRESYVLKDLERMASLFSKEREMAYVGPLGEVSLGYEFAIEQIKREFERFERIGMQVGWKDVIAHNEIAMLLTKCTLDLRIGKRSIKVPGGLTMSIKKNEDGWRIIMIHFGTFVENSEQESVRDGDIL